MEYITIDEGLDVPPTEAIRLVAACLDEQATGLSNTNPKVASRLWKYARVLKKAADYLDAMIDDLYTLEASCGGL